MMVRHTSQVFLYQRILERKKKNNLKDGEHSGTMREREKSKMFVRSCEIIESLFEQLWMDTLLLSRIRLESSEIGCCSVAPGSTASLMEILLFVRNHKLQATFVERKLSNFVD